VVTLATGPQGQTVLIWAGAFHVEGQPVGVAVAEDLSPIEADVGRLRLAFTLGTLAVLVVVVIVQRAIVRWSLRPLERVREDCRRLEAGEVSHLGEDVPVEVRPLVVEVNRLLRVLSLRLERSRQGLANLAHAVKTPLTLLGQAADSLPGTDPRGAEIRQGVQRIQEVVDRELKRARLAGRPPGGQRFCPARELPDLAAVLLQVHGMRNLDLQVSAPPDLTFGGDREDLLELFGNLLDNAAKWARGRVVLQVGPGPGLAFTVEDDGPGVPEGEIGQLAARGVRLDEAVPGHGIGLAVSREIIEQYGGTLQFSRSQALGGLRVAVDLPP
jgi:signal transduction histidine kinase